MSGVFDPVTCELSGTSLIEASAGTGKTHNITTLFVRLLLERELAVEDILVVTFTNAATFELRDRIRSRVAEALLFCGRPEGVKDADLRRLLEARREHAAKDRRRLAEAVHSFDEAAISTIHGFCQRVLQEYAFESGAAFGAELVADETPLREEVVRDFWVRELYEAKPVYLEYLASQKETPSTLSQLARRVLGNPDLEVLPDEVTIPEAGDIDAWRKAFAKVKEAWAAEREDVMALFRKAYDDDILNKGRIKEKFFDETPGQVTAALEVEQPAVSLRSDRFRTLTREGAVAATKQARRDEAPRHPFLDLCQELHDLEAPFRAHLPAWHVDFQRRFIEWGRKETVLRKERARVQSFDDLLVQVRDALRGPGGEALAAKLRDRYRAALIDEFQDTDPVQWEIFHRVWAGTGLPLFVIGDPKQSIYAFRGADVRAYLDARRAAAEGQDYGLATNYRSDPKLLRALNTLFGRVDDPFLDAEIGYRPVEPDPTRTDTLDGAGIAPFRVQLLLRKDVELTKHGAIGARGRAEIPDRIASDVCRLLREKADGITIPARGRVREHTLHPGDIAVLCRTNLQAYEVQRALAARRIPAVVHGDRSVFESPEATELLAVLEALADPTNPPLVRAALVTSLFGVSGNDLEELTASDVGWDTRVDAFTRWHGDWLRRGFMQAFRAMMDEPDPHDGLTVPGRLLGLPLGERRLTNVLHVAELLHAASVREHRGPAELIDWLRQHIADSDIGGGLSPEEVQIRLESDAEAVTLTTVHKAKGLEWPFVFCPYLWVEYGLGKGEHARRVRFHPAPEPREEHAARHGSIPPDDGAAGRVRVCLDIGSDRIDDHKGIAKREIAAEDRRLLYVALTRARQHVSVVWGGFHATAGTAMAAFFGKPARDEGMYEHLEELGSASGGAIEVEALRRADATPWPGPAGEAVRLAARKFARTTLDRDWRTSSFTEMSRGRMRRLAPTDEGRDHDQAATAAAEAAPPGDAGTGGAIALADFPRGAAAGTLVHGILERLDFAAAPQAVLEAVAKRLGEGGARWVAPLTDAIGKLLAVPLPGTDPVSRLADVTAGRRLAEMEFVLPVDPARGRLTPDALADVLAAHGGWAGEGEGAADVERDYVTRLRALDFRALHGFLRGFVDLVFESGGRYFVADWKTNHLGDRLGDYARDRLTVAMASHHYVLQYHLYVVALHRHLRLRLRDYDYDRHVGGAHYLFLRGIDGTSDAGVFFHRPPRETIEALSTLFGKVPCESS